MNGRCESCGVIADNGLFPRRCGVCGGSISATSDKPPVTLALTYEEAATLMWEIGEGGIRTPGTTQETSEKFRAAIERSRQRSSCDCDPDGHISAECKRDGCRESMSCTRADVAQLRLERDVAEAHNCDLGWMRIGDRTWIPCVVCHPEWAGRARSKVPTTDDCEPEPVSQASDPPESQIAETACERCEGRGVYPDRDMPYSDVTCSRCNGTGMSRERERHGWEETLTRVTEQLTREREEALRSRLTKDQCLKHFARNPAFLQRLLGAAVEHRKRPWPSQRDEQCALIEERIDAAFGDDQPSKGDGS